METIYEHGELTIEKSTSDFGEYNIAFTQAIMGEEPQTVEIDKYDFEILAERLGWHSDEEYVRLEDKEANAEYQLTSVRDELERATERLSLIAERIGGHDGRAVEWELGDSRGDVELMAINLRDALEALERVVYDSRRSVSA